MAKVSRLPNLVLFPSVSMAGLQFKHGREHAHPSPCRAVLPLSPLPPPPVSSPPETWSAFYKAAKERSFHPPASVKAKPQPARVVLLSRTGEGPICVTANLCVAIASGKSDSSMVSSSAT